MAESDATVESESGTESSDAPSGSTAGSPNGNRDIQKVLNRTFGIDVDEVLPDDVQRVIEDFEDQLEEMQNSEGVEVARTVLNRARLLFRMLGAWADGSFSLPWRSVAAITGALTYLGNPMGVLPEFVKGDESLLDDALVVFLCYQLLEKDLQRFVEEEGLDPAEYGL